MRRTGFLLFSLLLSAAARAQEAPDTVKIYFGFNEDRLTDDEQFHLDSLQYKGLLRPGQQLKIIGYGDYVGGDTYNSELSARRAARVQDYLISSGFRQQQIVLVLGKGRVDRPGMAGSKGFAPDRRVDLVLNAPAEAGLPKAPSPLTRVPPSGPDTLPAASPVPLPGAIDLSKMQVNQTFVLDNIYFHTGRHFIKKESLPALDNLVVLLNENPNVKVRIEGHVCCIGPSMPDALDDDTGGLNLSVNRARYIYDYLVKNGADPARLAYVGFGHRFPVIPNEKTDAEAQQNRRVEIRIIGK